MSKPHMSNVLTQCDPEISKTLYCLYIFVQQSRHQKIVIKSNTLVLSCGATCLWQFLQWILCFHSQQKKIILCVFILNTAVCHYLVAAGDLTLHALDISKSKTQEKHPILYIINILHMSQVHIFIINNILHVKISFYSLDILSFGNILQKSFLIFN